MLIGQENTVSQTLAENINEFFPAKIILLDAHFEEQLKSVTEPPEFVFVNLMDVNDPGYVSNLVRHYFEDATIVGIHSFSNQVLIDQILALGYDRYLTVFNLAQDLPILLQRA